MKALLMTTLLATTLATGQADPAQFDVAAQPANAAASLPLGTPPTASDLQPDPQFQGSGRQIVDLDSNDNGDKKMDVALRTFAAPDGKYWLVGYNRKQPASGEDPDEPNLAIARIQANGLIDGYWYGGWGYPGDAWLTPSVMNEVVDVVKIGSRFYFVGNRKYSGVHQWDIVIRCLDVATVAPCDGFGFAGVVGITLDLGDNAARHNDFAHRAIDCGLGSLCIAGTADTGSGNFMDYAAFVMKVKPDGALDTTFAPTSPVPGVFIKNYNFIANGDDEANDLILHYEPGLPNPTRLIFVGETARAAANDTDGFIFSVNATNGSPDGVFDTKIYFDVSNLNREDRAYRIIRRANGKYLVAGNAGTDSLKYDLFLAQFTAAGAYDTAFGTGGKSRGFLSERVNYPYALAERRGAGANREIVMGVNHTPQPLGSDMLANSVLQVPANGRLAIRARTDWIVPRQSGEPEFNQGRDLVIDAQQRVLMAATSRWSTIGGQWNMVIARMVAGDGIFADQFGGSSSD